MSGQQTAVTLKEILLSISESLNDAQQQLRNMQPYDQFGRANVLYTLPYLDFNIKVEVQAVSSQTSSTNTVQPLATRALNTVTPNQIIGSNTLRKNVVENRVLFTTTPTIGSSSSSTENKISSSISGRFVAIPPNEGLPQIYLSETIETIETNVYERKLKILVGNSAGEKIPGTKVEINFVAEESDAGLNAPSLSAAEVYTSNIAGEHYGVAETIITLNQTHINKNLVYEINVGPISKRISIN